MRLIILCLCALHGWTADQTQRLIAFDPAVVAKQIAASDPAQVAVALVGAGAKRVVQVTCAAGAPGYPGVAISAPGDSWDLSKLGYVEARVRNAGQQAIDLTVRVDNVGDWKLSPWNSEHIGIKPGETRAVRVRFGYSFGQPGYALDPRRIPQVLVFVTASAAEQVFVIESLTVGGRPGEKP